MTHLITKVMLTGLIVASTHLHAENYDFKPGLWETTWKSEIVEIDAPPEMEKMMRSMAKRPDYTETECINDIASAFDLEPEENEGEECQTDSNWISTNKKVFETSCTSPDGASKTVGEMRFNGKTFTSKLEVTISEESMKVKSKLVGNGKYIGACD